MSGDSSSSEDDDTKQFDEAVDKDFLTNDLYNSEKSNKNEEEPSKPLPSLRNQNHEKVSINPFSIKVTPEFQKYVAKNLTKMLDELIHEKDFSNKKRKITKLRGGVKLLRNSKNLLQSTSDIFVTNERYEKKYDEEEVEKRAKEVAVTPDWILSKEETKHWAPSTKGEMEIVKLNGTNLKKKKKKKKKKVQV